MEIKTKIWIDNGTPDFEFSIAKQEYIVRDGQEIKVGEEHRLGVTPLDLDKVMDFVQDTTKEPISAARTGRNRNIHPTIQMLTSVWTEEVQESYKEKNSPILEESLIEFNAQTIEISEEELDNDDGVQILQEEIEIEDTAQE